MQIVCQNDSLDANLMRLNIEFSSHAPTIGAPEFVVEHCIVLFVDLTLAATVMHSILVLFQANTLNVAFNSHNKSLLTIMMSNNVCHHHISTSHCV